MSGIAIVLAAVVAAEYWIWGDSTAACAIMTCARHVARLQDFSSKSIAGMQDYTSENVYTYCMTCKGKKKKAGNEEEARREGKKERKTGGEGERETERERGRVIYAYI